jgi:hypothetical protein
MRIDPAATTMVGMRSSITPGTTSVRSVLRTSGRGTAAAPKKTIGGINP